MKEACSSYKLKEDFKSVGLKSGELVMVHASMRALNPIDGGAETLIECLLDTVQPNGAIMMYLGCNAPYDDVGRGNLLPVEEEKILQNCSAFDPKIEAANIDHGMLPELFRTFPETICSNNVGWRMAANGDRAEWFMADHPLQYGSDQGSPMDKLYQEDGKILLLGSDLDQVTFLHFVEGITDISDKRTVNIKVPLNVNGQKQWVEVEEHNSSTGICDWPDRFFETLMKAYFTEFELEPVRIANAKNCYLISTQHLTAFAKPYMEAEAKNLGCIISP